MVKSISKNNPIQMRFLFKKKYNLYSLTSETSPATSGDKFSFDLKILRQPQKKPVRTQNLNHGSVTGFYI